MYVLPLSFTSQLWARSGFTLPSLVIVVNPRENLLVIREGKLSCLYAPTTPIEAFLQTGIILEKQRELKINEKKIISPRRKEISIVFPDFFIYALINQKINRRLKTTIDYFSCGKSSSTERITRSIDKTIVAPIRNFSTFLLLRYISPPPPNTGESPPSGA